MKPKAVFLRARSRPIAGPQSRRGASHSSDLGHRVRWQQSPLLSTASSRLSLCTSLSWPAGTNEFLEGGDKGGCLFGCAE